MGNMMQGKALMTYFMFFMLSVRIIPSAPVCKILRYELSVRTELFWQTDYQ